MLAMLNRTHSTISRDAFLPTYSVLIRSQLENGVRAWFANLVGDTL